MEELIDPTENDHGSKHTPKHQSYQHSNNSRLGKDKRISSSISKNYTQESFKYPHEHEVHDKF